MHVHDRSLIGDYKVVSGGAAPVAVQTAPAPRNWYSAWGKRLFDVAFTLVLFVLLAPLFALTALCVLLSVGRPVFYGSPRLGRTGTFACLKFRTMICDADAVLAELLATDSAAAKQYSQQRKLDPDPRITRVGHFLRRTSLDELPQFINVLRGEMSVVGPRPKLLDEDAAYGTALPTVLSVRPGVTGPWQVSGRNDLPYQQRIVLDTAYVESHGLVSDLVYVAKTVAVVTRPRRSGAR